METSDLRRFSPMTYVLERTFFFLQFLSPAIILFGTRIAAQRIDDPATFREVAARRGRRIELYVLVWALLEGLAAVVVPRLSGRCLLAVACLPAFRIFEIFQSIINLNVFDRLRMGTRPHYVAALARTMLLSMWNFVELILCFGILYSSKLTSFNVLVSAPDAYYFSVITQLTIGYGDIAPVGTTRLIVSIQVIGGFIVALFALSRVIAFLPRLGSVIGDD